VGHPIGVTDGVLHRQESAPGVAEHGYRVVPKMRPEAVQVIDLGGDADVLRRDTARRTPAAPLVVVDQAERLSRPVELRP
jgi:hypothetical protein